MSRTTPNLHLLSRDESASRRKPDIILQRQLLPGRFPSGLTTDDNSLATSIPKMVD
jgi:hypothetical protein